MRRVLTKVLDEAPHDIIYFWKMRAWPDFLQMTGTFLLTLLFSIEVGSRMMLSYPSRLDYSPPLASLS